MIITYDSWKQYFPYDEPRQQQIDAINFVLDAFLNQRKKFCVLECAVGVGKSAIGITVARFLRANSLFHVNYALGAYVLSTQKVLVSQYTNDFGPKSRNITREISSASNFTCLYKPDQKCSESRRVLKALKARLQGTEFYDTCKNSCPYTLAKREFMNADIGVTNMSYFLAETKYAHQLEPRSLLVVDEAHNLVQELSSFIEVTLSEKFAKDILGCQLIKGVIDQKSVFDWIKKVYRPALKKKMSALEKQIEIELAGCDDTSLQTASSKQYEMLDKHECKTYRFVEAYDPSNWVLNVVEVVVGNNKHRKFEFKPVDVSRYSEDHLFSFGQDHVLLMSATIVNNDEYCKSIGVHKDNVAYFSAPSPFPAENRKIHLLPVGSMSKKHIDDNLPILAQTISMLLESHSKDKGIIHCVTYKIAEYIKNAVKSDRLLLHNSEDRDRVLRQHMSSKKPTVLLSPSMTEGIDLSDDKSRFQILCKVPYPYLMDNVTKKRMLLNPNWYAFQTTKTIIQALGRSIRNENDFAVSYILDSDWNRFYSQNKWMFPIDFHELIQQV